MRKEQVYLKSDNICNPLICLSFIFLDGAQTKHIALKRIGLKPIATKPIGLKPIGY